MIPDTHKTVIVTGASQGIGAGLVKAFLGCALPVLRGQASANSGPLRQLLTQKCRAF